jgi:DNA processing protein
MAGELALGCAVQDWTVVSGGAYGIDAAAHRGALAANRPTLCVLAGGIDRLYPAGHAPMLRRILERGCLVSEAAPGCAPSRTRFLVRNRLIAAQATGTVVVEAAVRSGSLNTARWAADLGREVMGVPGPVTSAASRGVHELLREEHAVLVTTAAQVVEQLAPIGEALTPHPAAPPRAVDGLPAQTQRVLDAVPRRKPASTASIALTAGLARPLVARRLDWLLASGWVLQSEPGHWVAATQSPDGPAP